MTITLIHPPLDDPTIPYHSTAYLAGHLVKNGFSDIRTRDLNIEFVDYCLQPATVCAFYQEVERRLRRFESRSQLDLLSQEEFLGLFRAPRLEPGTVHEAANCLRDRDAFLDYPVYLASVRTLKRYFEAVAALCYPAVIQNFRLSSMDNYSVYNFDDLFDCRLADQLCWAFSQFFCERLANDQDLAASRHIGISIVYDHQLPFAVWLARSVKNRWPEKNLIFGGTSISGIYKHTKNVIALKRFFDVCDAIVVGEGETAICEIAASSTELQGNPSIPNTITYDAQHDRLHLPAQIHYENLPALGTPLYRSPWEKYLSPAKCINYAPTRGCYWNRCTFCDYGLNTDRPTSPWRERKIDQVIADLNTVITQEKIRYVYFAVDVMAPGYLERLSDAIVEAGLDIHWAAELRMEKIFTVDRCNKMAKSGCVCVSFGMESGSQRILNLIDKGTRISYMADTLKNFEETSVAVQLMAFSGFPGETAMERRQTSEFVHINQPFWSNGGLSKFMLTGGAIVCKNAEKFGIEVLETNHVDVARKVAYRERVGAYGSGASAEESDQSFNDSGDIFPETLGRPWAGGIDTLHSMMYYEAHGKSFFKDHPIPKNTTVRQKVVPPSSTELDRAIVRLNGRLAQSWFDLDQLARNAELHRTHVKELRAQCIEPTFQDLFVWQSAVDPIQRLSRSQNNYIVTDECAKKLNPMLHLVLSPLSAHRVGVDELIAPFDPRGKSVLLGSIARLVASGFIGIEQTHLR